MIGGQFARLLLRCACTGHVPTLLEVDRARCSVGAVLAGLNVEADLRSLLPDRTLNRNLSLAAQEPTISNDDDPRQQGSMTSGPRAQRRPRPRVDGQDRSASRMQGAPWVGSAIQELAVYVHRLNDQKKYMESIRVYDAHLQEGRRRAKELGQDGKMPKEFLPDRATLELLAFAIANAAGPAPQFGPRRDQATIQIIDIQRFLNDINEMGLHPNSYIMHNMLKALKSLRAPPSIVREIFAEMQRHDIKSVATTYRLALEVLLQGTPRETDIELIVRCLNGLSTFEAVEEERGMVLRVARFCITVGRFTEALKYMDRARELDVTIRPVIFIELMCAAAEADRIDLVNLALRLLNPPGKDPLSGRAASPGGAPCPGAMIEEGQSLRVLNCAVRHHDPFLAEQIFGKLLDSLRYRSGSSKEERSSTSPHLIPRPYTYQSYIHALVNAKQYLKAFEVVHQLESHHTDKPQCLSAFRGLGFFAEQLDSEEALALAYSALQQRQASGAPVTTIMLNIILRGIARLGNVEAAGKVFESGFTALGLNHNADSYNAVMEACVVGNKGKAVESLFEYMKSKTVEPNGDSYNQLLLGLIGMGDCDAIIHVLQRCYQEGLVPRLKVLQKALELAQTKQHTLAVNRIRMELRALGEDIPADEPPKAST